MDVINKREFEQNGCTVIVTHVVDPDRSCETAEQLQSNYAGEPDADKAKYFKQDVARFKSWRRQDWFYIGICVDIRVQTSANWADGGPIIGRSSIWGVESDDPEHIAELTTEQIAEAWADVGNLKAALCPALEQLSKVSGMVSISNGVASLPDGSTLTLAEVNAPA